MSFQTGVLNFALFTKLPSPPSSPVRTPPQLLDVGANTRRLAVQFRRRLSRPSRPNPISPLLFPRNLKSGELAVSHGRRRGSASPWRSPFRPSFARSEPADSFPESPCCSTTISPPPTAAGAAPPRSSAAAGRLLPRSSTLRLSPSQSNRPTSFSALDLSSPTPIPTATAAGAPPQ